MTRTRVRTAVLALAFGILGQIAAAQTLQDDIVAQLRDQGFVEFNVEQTILGRIRIVALSATLRREIVLTRSGQILRDYWEHLDGSTDTDRRPILSDPHEDDGGGDDDDRRPDDGADDDGADDDRDDDESDDDESDDGDRDHGGGGDDGGDEQ